MTPLTPSEIDALVLSWKNHAKALDYRPGTKTYAKMETEFFIGVIAALLALQRSHPPAWELLILSGRSISATYSSAAANHQSEGSQP